jgi:hypothetical protein
MTFFIKAESISSNNELKAKSVFQASKCELDLFFSKETMLISDMETIINYCTARPQDRCLND